MVYTNKQTKNVDWDEVNFERGRVGSFYEGTYEKKDGSKEIVPFAVVTVGQEMVESLLQEMKQFSDPRLSLFLNERKDKNGNLRKFLSFKVDEKFSTDNKKA